MKTFITLVLQHAYTMQSRSIRKFKNLRIFHKNPKSLYSLSMNTLLMSSTNSILCMKKSLPITIYTEYLQMALESIDYFWFELLHCFDYCECDIVEWNLDDLTLEQQLLLKHYPSQHMPCFATEFIHILKISFDSIMKKNICSNCARNQYSAVDEILDRYIFTQYISVYNIAEFIRDPEQWCSACKQQPLFCMSNGTNDEYFKAFNSSEYDVSMFIRNNFNNYLGLSTQMKKNEDNVFVCF